MNTTPDQHTLSYPGHVKPAKGQLMGPSTDGRLWYVLDSMHDPDAKRTFVTCEQIVPKEDQ